MGLDANLAKEAVDRHVAKPLGMGLLEAAEGIVRIIDVKMQEAIKAISTRRGHDLRDFTLVAFGGAGPVHAGRIARELGMKGVMVPQYPGVTSAMGLLMADVRRDHMRSRLEAIHTLDVASAERTLAELELAARSQLRSDGFDEKHIAVERQLDLRYAGQGYEVTVTVPSEALSPSSLAEVRGDFDEQHESLFGHKAEDEVVEVVNYRVVGFGLVPKIELKPSPPASGSPQAAATRDAYFPELGGMTATAVYDRATLGPGHAFAGPAIVEQPDSTTVVFPGQRARVDEWLNIMIEAAA
jgi:N-methylhydantoinase A